MVLSSLFEVEEEESFAWDFGTLEVRSQESSSNSVHEDLLFEISVTHDLG